MDSSIYKSIVDCLAYFSMLALSLKVLLGFLKTMPTLYFLIALIPTLDLFPKSNHM